MNFIFEKFTFAYLKFRSMVERQGGAAGVAAGGSGGDTIEAIRKLNPPTGHMATLRRDQIRGGRGYNSGSGKGEPPSAKKMYEEVRC